MIHRSKVPVCGDCLPLVEELDTDHTDHGVAGTIEIMHNPTITSDRPDGYFRCFVCGHDCLGGRYVTFDDHG